MELSQTERSMTPTHQLSKLLEGWDDNGNVTATHVTEMVDTINDEIKILATKIHSVNAINQDHFACSTQLDVEESETYARAM